jgi:hypothetical protein
MWSAIPFDLSLSETHFKARMPERNPRFFDFLLVVHDALAAERGHLKIIL